MKQVSFVLALLLCVPALAQDSLPRYKGNITDFTRVHVICLVEGDGDTVTANICQTIENTVRDEANKQRLDVQSGGMEESDSFTLRVILNTSGIVPRAIAVRVEATRMYEGAIEQRGERRQPAGSPRAGKMVFWEKQFVAVTDSPRDRLETVSRGMARTLVRDFFAWYKARS